MLVTGCATQQSKDNFSTTILGLKGYDKDAVLRQLGAPDSIAEMSNGEILTYRKDQNDKVSGYYDYTFKCQIDFIVEHGTVSDVRYTGNSNHPYYRDIDNCARVFGNR